MFDPDHSHCEAEAHPRIGAVLIVEDDGMISLSMESTARELGAVRVEVIGDPADAARAARKGAFDCAILDIFVGAGSTYEVADILAERRIPFIFCTGLSVFDVDERHRHRPILPKPYSENDLKACFLRMAGG